MSPVRSRQLKGMPVDRFMMVGVAGAVTLRQAQKFIGSDPFPDRTGDRKAISL